MQVKPRPLVLALVFAAAIGCDPPKKNAPSAGATTMASASTSSAAAPFVAQPTRPPVPTLRFASTANDAVDKVAIPLPAHWMIEDPNLEGLLPTGEAVELEERWRVDDVYVSLEKTRLVMHRLRAELAVADAHARDQALRARVAGFHFGPAVVTPTPTFTDESLGSQVVVDTSLKDVNGLSMFAIGPRAPWSELPVQIFGASSKGLFQIGLVSYLDAKHAVDVATFARDLPQKKTIDEMGKSFGGDLVEASYTRRVGRVPAASVTFAVPPNPALWAKIDAVAEEPLSFEARMKKEGDMLGAYWDRWTERVKASLKSRGFQPNADRSQWKSGTTTALVEANEVTVLFGDVPPVTAK